MDSLFYFISELVDIGGLAHQRIDLFEIWFLFQYYFFFSTVFSKAIR